MRTKNGKKVPLRKIIEMEDSDRQKVKDLKTKETYNIAVYDEMVTRKV